MFFFLVTRVYWFTFFSITLKGKGKINFVICLEARVYLFYKFTAFFLCIQLCHLCERGRGLFFLILFSTNSLGIIFNVHLYSLSLFLMCWDQWPKSTVLKRINCSHGIIPWNCIEIHSLSRFSWPGALGHSNITGISLFAVEAAC